MATAHPAENARRLQRLREMMASSSNPVLTRAKTFLAYLVDHPPVAQGSYYVVRGIWPLIGALFFWEEASIRTYWHSQTTGLLILTIGVTLLIAAWRRQVTVELLCLALGSAAGLALLQFGLVLGREISPLYLLDVGIQTGLVLLWSTSLLRNKGSLLTPGSPSPNPAPPHAPATIPPEVPVSSPLVTAPRAEPIPTASPILPPEASPSPAEELPPARSES